jgi:DNA transformation protein
MKRHVSELKNIGTTVAARLYQIGITSEADLRKVGAARAYRRLAERQPGKHLAVCYYLYSLEGALQDRHWDSFSAEEKRQLRLAAGLTN